MVRRLPSILLLPAELKHHIAKLCSSHSLASLARTHSAFQIQAEQALYHTLFIVIDESFGCIETLATNPEKASYVRVLKVVCTWLALDSDLRIAMMTYLSNGLINMHSLSDFGLKMRYYDVQACQELYKCLCNGHFQLKNLFWNWNFVHFDILQIIKCQPELQVLGIYQPPYELLAALRQLHNAQLFLPVIYTLEEYDGWGDRDLDLGIFPVLYSVDRNALMHQVLAEYLDPRDITQLSIDLIDFSNLATIHTLAQKMAVTFPWITRLCFFFTSRCGIPSQDSEFEEFISFFSKLDSISFSYWPKYDVKVPAITEDVGMTHAREWMVVCPKLFSVTFMDDSRFYKGRDNEWNKI